MVMVVVIEVISRVVARNVNSLGILSQQQGTRDAHERAAGGQIRT